MRGLLRRYPWAALLLLVPFLVVGCDNGDEGTGPEGADLAATATAVDDAVDEYLYGNQALLSITVLSGAMGDACGGGSLFDVTSPFAALDVLENRAPAVLLDARTPEPISEDCLGQSMVLDPATGNYVAGGGGDVPANGVRFELYEVTQNGELVTPLNAIGYVDVVDNSTETSIAGYITAVVGGETMIDFSGTVTGGISTLNLDADGYFSPDGSKQMEIDVEGSLDVETEAFDVGATLETDEISVSASAEGAASIEGESITGTFESEVQHDGTRVVLEGDLDASGNVAGDVVVNGSVVATFTVDVETENFVITDTSDGALTQDDLNAIEAMFSSALEGVLVVASLALVLLLLAGGL